MAKKTKRAPLPKLPRVRSYIVPYDEGDVLLDRDYSQQEPRNLAHYEDGALKEAYVANPWTDYHDDAKNKLESMLKRPMKRKVVKGFNLGIIYGMGTKLMAAKADIPVEEAKVIREAILSIYPGLREMYKDMKVRAKAKQPIRTWGGREHYCEPPKLIDGRLVHFDYKMVNKLIQGSSADQTKEAMIRLWNAAQSYPWLRLLILLTVHDELAASVPKRYAHAAMKLVKECMESIELDVPMLSEGTWSEENLASLEDYDKKGKDCYAH